VALTYRATVDVPARFRNSKAVGAVFGLTPSRYQSGEVNRTGAISRCGDEMMRAMLYEAAHIMLVRLAKWSWLKAWAMKIARQRGIKHKWHDKTWVSQECGKTGRREKNSQAQQKTLVLTREDEPPAQTRWWRSIEALPIGRDAPVPHCRPLATAMVQAGAGQAAKICNNMMLGISMIGVCEAFVLAEKLGLSHQALFEVASSSSGQCWSLTNYCPVPGPVPNAPSNNSYKAGFASALMLKDLKLYRAVIGGQFVVSTTQRGIDDFRGGGPKLSAPLEKGQRTRARDRFVGHDDNVVHQSLDDGERSRAGLLDRDTVGDGAGATATATIAGASSPDSGTRRADPATCSITRDGPTSPGCCRKATRSHTRCRRA
jgi:hypothetical protein